MLKLTMDAVHEFLELITNPIGPFGRCSVYYRLLSVPIFGPRLRVCVLLRPCFCWQRLSICLCVISSWHRLRIAEGTRRSSIFRWTPMSLTLITVHNRRHHFILNLARASRVFFFFSSLPLSKWKRVASHASFISMKHGDTLKLTGINADKLRTLGMHVIYWYPLSLVAFSLSDMLCHPEGGRDDESRPPRNTICMMECTVLRGRIKGKINDLGVHTDK